MSTEVDATIKPQKQMLQASLSQVFQNPHRIQMRDLLL